ncbi:MAG: DUF2812 domain-containing protein [Deltaproteobacteria bacterium]|nr:MAG: DUF2812 domain-containing protein [Deltaproteobacteria bacterium]
MNPACAVGSCSSPRHIIFWRLSMKEIWEYHLAIEPKECEEDLEKIQAWLNELGEAGWELINILGNCYYFKRRK